MNSLVYSLMAAGCTSLSSLFFRKNSDSAQGTQSPTGYLLLFYLISFIASFFISSNIWHVEIDPIILGIGICVGILTSVLMLLTAHALKRGPSGLTFAFQNASAVFPGLILFLLLGSDFGFSCSSLQIAGMALVLFGLFWGARKSTSNGEKASGTWLKYAVACFVVQILALTLIQSRCIFFDSNVKEGFIAKFHLSEASDVWFMPGQFGAAVIMQGILFLKERKKLQKNEIIYSSFGGIANFLSTCLLLLATKLALPTEKGILFPCFSVGAMILCNLWANRLYKEKFNLTTNILCSLGIFLAAARL